MPTSKIIIVLTPVIISDNIEDIAAVVIVVVVVAVAVVAISVVMGVATVVIASVVFSEILTPVANVKHFENPRFNF